MRYFNIIQKLEEQKKTNKNIRTNNKTKEGEIRQQPQFNQNNEKINSFDDFIIRKPLYQTNQDNTKDF